MTTLFVSHSGTDRELTAGIRLWLKDAGYGSLFVDFDPADGIAPGRRWETELYAQLRKADAVVFLATAASTVAPWCFAEVSLARALGRPVFPVRVEPGATLDLLNDCQWVDLAEGDTALVRLRSALKEAGLGPERSMPWDRTRSPYPGLVPFEAADAAVFFGREDELGRLLALLAPTPMQPSGRFVAILGPSGSGKSSLMRAGLLPRLGRVDRPWVVLSPLRPGPNPTERLAERLAEACAVHGVSGSTEDVAAEINRGPSGLKQVVDRLAARIDDPDAGRPGVLVVIDQAEELLRHTEPKHQEDFLALLAGALSDDGPLCVVVTLRSEFLSADPSRAGFARVITDLLLVEPLGKLQLHDVIARPASRAGVEIEPELVSRMVEETEGGDALPLLAYTLSALYERRGPDGRISRDDYKSVGGVIGALHRQADRIVEELTHQGLGASVLPTLLKLTAVESDGGPVRRRVLRRDMTQDERLVVDMFVEARLLTSTAEPHEPSESGAVGDGAEAVIEVAHEALLRQWPPLRTAIGRERAWLIQRSELDRLAADWERGRRDESFLLRGGRLAGFEHWAADHSSSQISPLVRDFLSASRDAARHDLEEAQRSNRQLIALTSRLRNRARILVALLLAMVVAGGVAWYQSGQAEAQTRLAGARQMAAHADRLSAGQPDLAVLVGLQSWSLARGQDPAPPTGLVTGLARLQHPSRQLVGHVGPVTGVAARPDGTTIATSGTDGAVRLWDVASGNPRGQPLAGGDGPLTGVTFNRSGTLVATTGGGVVHLWDSATGLPRGRPLSGHAGVVTGVAFGPDGTLVATSGADGTVRLWETATGRPRGQPMTGHTGVVTGVAFGPDGRTVASSGADFTARLWDVATGRARGQPLTGSTAVVRTVAFSPDGRTVATAGDDALVRLWDTGTAKPRGAPLRGHTNWVQAVAFSPDGRFLATGSADTTVRLWETATGLPRGLPLAGHTNRVNGVTFAPGGAVLASVGDDQTVRLWTVDETFSLSRPLTGHRRGIRDVAVHTGSGLLASASEDKTVRIWDMRTGRPRGQALTGHTEAVAGVAFSRDGSRLASSGWDGSVRLWDPRTGAPRDRPLLGHTGRVDAVAFSPDGRTLASASSDSTVRLWDASDGRPLGPPLTGHAGAVRDVAFSPDGRLLASVGQDLTVRLWDAPTGAARGPPLVGHTSAVIGVAFSPDSTLVASTSDDLTVRLWEAETGRPHGAPLTGHTKWVRGVAFSPDGALLATTGHDQVVRLWDVARAEPYGPPLSGHTGPVRGVEFGADGTLVTAGGEGDDTVRVWNPKFRSWVSSSCQVVNRNLTQAEWNMFVPGQSYERTCESLPAGPDAPPDAPAAEFDD